MEFPLRVPSDSKIENPVSSSAHAPHIPRIWISEIGNLLTEMKNLIFSPVCCQMGAPTRCARLRSVSRVGVSQDFFSRKPQCEQSVSEANTAAVDAVVHESQRLEKILRDSILFVEIPFFRLTVTMFFFVVNDSFGSTRLDSTRLGLARLNSARLSNCRQPVCQTALLN